MADDAEDQGEKNVQELAEGLKSMVTGLGQMIGATAEDYYKRRGISTGMVADQYSLAIEGFLNIADAADKKFDHKIRRDLLLQFVDASDLGDEDGGIDLKEKISKLPETFSISEEQVEAAVDKLVNALDVNKDGRIKEKELGELTPEVTKQFVQDLIQAAR